MKRVLIIHDKRLPGEYKKALKKKLPSADLLPFRGISNVYGSISCHPDICLFQLDRETVIHSPGLPGDQLLPLEKNGMELVEGEESPSGEYPHAARYNAVRIRNVVFHNFDCTDPVILEKIERRGLKAVSVAQGYTRCSVLTVGEKGIITSDRSIAGAAESEGFDVLVLSAGSVVLPGEKYGFIGGAVGVAPDGTVVFLGDPAFHPEGDEIIGFLTRYNIDYIALEGMPLYDAGSLLMIG
ncbi:MAG: hypothetical protein U9R44_02840 [Candidatus Omnitrophota bacterium]|nr:hypothetical protein [Candidatus Omnitrophota bacterium]